jgi:hypothetical protein
MTTIGHKMLGQQLDFTCGPACTLFVLRHFGWTGSNSLAEEIAIWREANTVFMGRGNPGCCGEGLALSARRRGMASIVLQSEARLYFDFTVRNRFKKEVIVRATGDLEAEARRIGVSFATAGNLEATLDDQLERGRMALLLVRMSYRLRERTPHWVVVTGRTGRSYAVWDPYGGEREPGSSASLEVGSERLIAAGSFGPRPRRFSAVLIGRE